MKHIYIIALFAITFFSGCLDDKEFAEANSSETATIEVPSGEPYIQGLTEVIELEIELTEFSDPSLVESVSVYKSFDGAAVSKVDIDAGTITSFPDVISLSIDDLLEGLEISAEELAPGDAWSFSYKVNLKSGKTLSPQDNSTIAFSCLSLIEEGVYTAVSSGTSTDGCPSPNPVEDLAYEVTLTAIDGQAGNYEVSDYSAGVYQSWYGACYGYTFETSAVLTDVCNSISFTVTDAFSCSNSGTGTYDPDTGVISYTWSNCFGDSGSVVLTPK